MSERIRFHLDEHVPPGIAAALRRRGIDVVSTHEVGLRQATDAEQLAFALAEQRVIYTHDSDFLELASEGAPHAGIAFCYWNPRLRPLAVIDRLTELWERVTPDQMHNRVEYL